MCYLDLVVLGIIGGVVYLVYIFFKKENGRSYEQIIKSIDVPTFNADSLKLLELEVRCKLAEDKIIADQVKLVKDYIEEVRKEKNILEAKITKAINNTCAKCKCKKTINKIQGDETIVVCTKCKNEWLLSNQLYWYYHHVALDVLESVNKGCKEVLTYTEHSNWLIDNGIYKETMIKMDHGRINYRIPTGGIYIYKQDINNIDYLKSIKDPR